MTMMTKNKTNASLIKIHIAPGTPQFDVSEFPDGAKRSVEGNTALYFRQGTVMNVTADELKHIKKTRPDMVGRIRVEKNTKLTAEQIKSRMGALKKSQAKAKSNAQTTQKEQDGAPVPISKPNGSKETGHDAVSTKGQN